MFGCGADHARANCAGQRYSADGDSGFSPGWYLLLKAVAATELVASGRRTSCRGDSVPELPRHHVHTTAPPRTVACMAGNAADTVHCRRPSGQLRYTVGPLLLWHSHVSLRGPDPSPSSGTGVLCRLHSSRGIPAWRQARPVLWLSASLLPRHRDNE
jgi:hypothetical protein